MLKKFIIILFLSLTLSAFAAETKTEPPKWYQIDLIVFAQNAPATENWRNELLQPNLKRTIEVSPITELTSLTRDAKAKYVLLPDDKLGLQSEAQALENESNYQVIFQTSWIQSEDTMHHPKWIHLFGGQAYDANGNPMESTLQMGQKIPASQALILDTDEPIILTPAFWELNGKIKIKKSRFFDIYTHLSLTVPDDEAKNTIDTRTFAPLRSFAFNQHQRTKRDQLNYLDHPLFGILIKISEFKPDLVFPALAPGPVILEEKP